MLTEDEVWDRIGDVQNPDIVSALFDQGQKLLTESNERY